MELQPYKHIGLLNKKFQQIKNFYIIIKAIKKLITKSSRGPCYENVLNEGPFSVQRAMRGLVFNPTLYLL